jgi:hypothetical protein
MAMRNGKIGRHRKKQLKELFKIIAKLAEANLENANERPRGVFLPVQF